MTLERGVLELNADVDQDGTREKGVFHMVGGLQVRHRVEPLPVLLSGRGSLANAVAGSAVNEAQALITGSPTVEMKKRAGFYLDLGGGRHVFELNFMGWEGAQDASGDDLQWGTSDTPGRVTNNGRLISATGQPAIEQMALLMEFLRIGEYDSRAEHAKWRFGEYHDGTYGSVQGGEYEDYLHVHVEVGAGGMQAGETQKFDGSITLIEIEDFGRPIDAVGEIAW